MERGIGHKTANAMRLIALASCLLLALLFDATAAPKRSRKKKTPTPAPVASATPAAAPSADLQQFMSAHLEAILGPLVEKPALPRADLAQLRASIAQRFTRAGLADREVYQNALTICDALTQAMNERNQAQVGNSSRWPVRSTEIRQFLDKLVQRQQSLEAQAPQPSAH